MKRRSTTPVSNIKTTARNITLITVAFLFGVAAPLQITKVSADQYDDRIQALQAQQDEYQAQASKLKDQAETLQTALAAIQIQKKTIQTQIDLKQAEHDKLVAEIAENEQKIADNKDALGSTIADIYVDDNVSPLEMLASSNNIGDYIDKQTYRSTVQNNLTETITQIRTLKAQLESQKKDVDRVLAEQQLARDALSAKAQQQQNLIAQTQGQEAAYQKLSASTEQQKLQVQQQQQDAIEAAIRAASGRSGSSGLTILPGDANKGGYPWEAGCYVDANAVSHGGSGGDGTDPLGYGCRQCVSYAAYKVGAYSGNYPRYWGNANQWPASARSAGYTVSTTPRANSVGVIMAGAYGHVVWVEAVNDDGTVDVSQYNYYNAGGSGWGNYSKMRLSASTYTYYIYF